MSSLVEEPVKLRKVSKTKKTKRSKWLLENNQTPAWAYKTKKKFTGSYPKAKPFLLLDFDLIWFNLGFDAQKI